MRIQLIGRIVALLAVATLVALPLHSMAYAQTNQEQLDECLGDGLYPNGPPTCTFDSEGNLIDRDIPGAPGEGSGFGGFLVIALLWAALPMVIAGSIASSRGQSVGLAVLLTLVLGWIGLLIVVVLQKPEIVEAARNTVAAAGGNDVADQIRKLGALRDEGLLTEEEFTAKKARLLGTG
jgi:hypothetical protein